MLDVMVKLQSFGAVMEDGDKYAPEAGGLATAPPTLISHKQAADKVFICTRCPLRRNRHLA